MSNKKFYMIIDTETCGDLVFDFGYKVIDRKGNTYAEGSFVCAEYINNPEAIGMFTNYFTKNKIAKYYFSLFAGHTDFNIASFAEIRETLNAVRDTFNAIPCAYNAKFDISHLQITANDFGYAEFFEADCEWIDLWRVAMSVFTQSRNYLKFCHEYNLLSNRGQGKNMSTGAEAVYRYLLDCPDFVEAHTARADCEIEADILVRAFNRKKHFETAVVGHSSGSKEWRATKAKWDSMFK